MALTYFSLTLDLPEEDAELAEASLHDQGATGLEVRDREAPPMPGVRGPAVGEVIVVAFFETKQAAEEALQDINISFPRARTALAEVAQQDWSESWKSLIRSTQVGRLWVGPPWEKAQAPKDKVQLVIEPKMAFGTGDHPTTALCLAVVDDFMGSHPGASVLDVGTGSGLLAFAAKRLGASRVVGTDNDAMSVTLAKENAEVNQLTGVELLEAADLSCVSGTFDLVVANILANTLVDLAPQIAAKVGQRLALAGVLAHQADEVEAAYVRHSLKSAGRAQDGAWVRLDFTR